MLTYLSTLKTDQTFFLFRGTLLDKFTSCDKITECGYTSFYQSIKWVSYSGSSRYISMNVYHHFSLFVIIQNVYAVIWSLFECIIFQSPHFCIMQWGHITVLKWRKDKRKKWNIYKHLKKSKSINFSVVYLFIYFLQCQWDTFNESLKVTFQQHIFIFLFLEISRVALLN